MIAMIASWIWFGGVLEMPGSQGQVTGHLIGSHFIHSSGTCYHTRKQTWSVNIYPIKFKKEKEFVSAKFWVPYSMSAKYWHLELPSWKVTSWQLHIDAQGNQVTWQVRPAKADLWGGVSLVFGEDVQVWASKSQDGPQQSLNHHWMEHLFIETIVILGSIGPC